MTKNFSRSTPGLQKHGTSHRLDEHVLRLEVLELPNVVRPAQLDLSNEPNVSLDGWNTQ